MQKLLKPKILFLFFWAVVAFASIVILPDLKAFTSAQVIANDHTSPPYQRQWGHHLADTSSLTLVFNNPTGVLSKQQHQQITATLKDLQHQSLNYNIKQLRQRTQLTQDHQLLRSNDNSTELAQIAITTPGTELEIIANQLNNAIVIPGLRTAVTNPTLIQQQRARYQLHEAATAYLIGSIIILIILGLLFRSLLIPLINLLIQSITLVTSTSLITNMRLAWNLPFTTSSLALAGLVSLILTSLFTYSYMSDYQSTLATDDGPISTLNLTTLTRQYQRWLIVLVPLMLCTLILRWTSLITLATSWTLTIALIITTLATPTLNYAISSVQTANLFLPGKQRQQFRSQNSWGLLARFSHWQPFLGLIASGLLLIPGLVIAHPQVSETQLHSSSQIQLTNAEQGQQLLATHFGDGAIAPITLTLHANKRLTSQRNLQTIDYLTTQLRAIPNVSQVLSLTQPAGQPQPAFYVKNQIPTLNADLLGSQTIITQLKKQLSSVQSDLKQAAIGKHAQTVDQLSDQLNQLANVNDQLIAQLQKLPANVNSNTTTTTASTDVSDQLATFKQLTDQATALINHIVTTQTTVAKQAGKADHTLHNANKTLDVTFQPLQQLLTNLKETRSYLNNLKDSRIGDSFYLPTKALTSRIYQDSRLINLSSDQKTTRLTVTLASTPSSTASYKTLQQIEHVTHDSLLATPLAHTTKINSGLINEQSQQHRLIQVHALQWALLVLSLIAIMLWIRLRSLLSSVLLITGLALTVMASWGWTQLLITHWSSNALSNTAFIWGSLLLTMHWLIVAVPTIRHRHWLSQLDSARLLHHFYICGQATWSVTLLEVAALLPLLVVSDSTLRTTGFMVLIGIFISNLSIPMSFPGLVRWAVTLPKITIHHRPKKTN
ncbi:MMPL family transporter [Lactiplantibacillus herbarum]|uniref:MMPL family transporter n=1 Tax=Lactiplantibacillus herbarum TaxID=1670446 RepID=UPI00064FEAE2|nr:MMPL family transporter [Lactiplantibacillus herbarum]